MQQQCFLKAGVGIAAVLEDAQNVAPTGRAHIIDRIDGAGAHPPSLDDPPEAKGLQVMTQGAPVEACINSHPQYKSVARDSMGLLNVTIALPSEQR